MPSLGVESLRGVPVVEQLLVLGVSEDVVVEGSAGDHSGLLTLGFLKLSVHFVTHKFYAQSLPLVRFLSEPESSVMFAQL